MANTFTPWSRTSTKLLRVSKISTRSPGNTNPATPRTSLTRMVTAFMPSSTTADKVARWPGPVIFQLKIGSFASSAIRTKRSPASSSSSLVENVPLGTLPVGQAISFKLSACSWLPKRKGDAATTTVAVGVAVAATGETNEAC